MLMEDSPVARSTTPNASCANVLTTQVVGNPLTGTGGPKKQVASGAQPPWAPAQSASDVHSSDGALTQCWVGCGPVVQSARLVPRLATRFTPSEVLRMEVAFSGIRDGGSSEAPPPMKRQPRPRDSIGIVRTVSENSWPEKGPAPPGSQSEPGVVVNDRWVGSGGGCVVVVVLVVVVVVVVVGTVTSREKAFAKASIRDSTGASWVGVPHCLSDPLKELAAFWTQASSGAAPLSAAFDQHFATACAFLPIELIFLPKQMLGPGAPLLTSWTLLVIRLSTAASSEATSWLSPCRPPTRQSPLSCDLAMPLLKVLAAFWRHAASTGTPFWSALAQQLAWALAFLPAASICPCPHLLATPVPTRTKAMLSIVKSSSPAKGLGGKPQAWLLVMTTVVAPGAGKVWATVVPVSGIVCVTEPSRLPPASKPWEVTIEVPWQSRPAVKESNWNDVIGG